MGRIIYYVVCAALVILGFVYANEGYIGAAMIFFGGFGIWGGNKLHKLSEKSKEIQKAIDQVDCSYNENNKTLFVNESSSAFRSLIDVRQHDDKAYDYVKPSYVYTGASVGGITTGGVHKQGDYFKQSDYS